MDCWTLLTFATLCSVNHGFEALFQGSCEDHSLCDQVCIDLRDDTHECGCLDSFTLQPDGVSCLNSTASEWQQSLRITTDVRHTPNSETSTIPTSVGATSPPQLEKAKQLLKGQFYAEFQTQTDLNQLSIQLEFKPAVDNSVLLYAHDTNNSGDLFTLLYTDETLSVWLTCEGDNIRVQHESHLRLNEWHRVSIVRSNCRSVQISSDWNTDELPAYQNAHGKLYTVFIYGAPKTDLIDISADNYTGCVGTFQLNSIDLSTKYFHPEPCPSRTCGEQSCKNGGKCELLQTDFHMCTCPLGFTGSTCESEISIRIPEFSGRSWLKHLAPSDFDEYMELRMKLRPVGPEGIIFYCGQADLEQYVTVYLRDSFLHLQFDLGNGAAIIKSERRLALHQWHHVEVWRSGRGGLLKVDQNPWVEGATVGGFSKMSPGEFMFTGGAPAEMLPASLSQIPRGFQGCLDSLTLNQRRIPLITAAISGSNIAECGTGPCATHPCSNGGNCTTWHDTHVCLCPFPYTGDICQRKITKDNIKFGFKGTSYLKFEQQEVINHILGHDLDLEIAFKMEKSQESDEQILAFTGKETVAGDFLELGITPDGYTYVRYDLGDGEAEIIHDRVKVNDGEWHKVVAKRSGRSTTIFVDKHAPITKVLAGDNNQLNVYKALYIGSYPGQIGNLPQKGLRGCIAEIILGSNFRIDNIQQVTQAVNIHDCSDV